MTTNTTSTPCKCGHLAREHGAITDRCQVIVNGLRCRGCTYYEPSNGSSIAGE